MDELYRFMLSYDYDHSVENIWIECSQSVFSHGLDYKRLTEDPNYLNKVTKLAILFAKINKPILAQISGGAKGAGAYLLSLITMPLGYHNTFLKIDDASRGLTPLLGGSHRMTRLPLHVGYYLALTGDEFNFEEMTQIGYVKGNICNDVKNSEIRSKLAEANLYFREKLRYTDFDDSELEHSKKERMGNN